jgi:hypothetical protein
VTEEAQKADFATRASQAGWWAVALSAALMIADFCAIGFYASTESDAAMLAYLMLLLIDAVLTVAELILAGILIYLEARGRVRPSAVAACLWAIVLSSLPLTFMFWVLLLIPAAALCAVTFYMGRKGRRFRELPAIMAFAAAWRQFRSRRKTDKPRFAWRMTQAQLPFFCAILTAGAVHLGIVVFGAAEQVGGHLEQALAMMGATYLGGASFILALLLAAIALAIYPWAHYQYAVVLQRFEKSEEADIARKSLATAFVLLFLDLALAILLLAPVALLLVAVERDWPGWPLLLTWLLWPPLMLMTTLFRLHYREVSITQDLSPVAGLAATFRMVTTKFFDVLRGTVLQVLCYLPVVLIAWFAAPFILIAVSIPAAVFAALHAIVWWGIGYQGSGHLWALLVEVPALSLLFLLGAGYLTSPISLLQALYRAAYVRLLLKGDEDTTSSVSTNASCLADGSID